VTDTFHGTMGETLPVRFDGESFDQAQDGARLSAQLEKVKALMLDGAWRTLEEIQDATGVRSSASVSARIRDLRKPRFGRYLVERRRVVGGLFEYRVAPGADAICNASESRLRQGA
jgi:hypothetical protein